MMSVNQNNTRHYACRSLLATLQQIRNIIVIHEWPWSGMGLFRAARLPLGRAAGYDRGRFHGGQEEPSRQDWDHLASSAQLGQSLDLTVGIMDKAQIRTTLEQRHRSSEHGAQHGTSKHRPPSIVLG